MAIVSTPLTYQLANGQTVDAAQLMANFNQIANNVNANACPATTGTAILKGNNSGGTAAAVAGTDFCPATGTGTGVLKGNGSGGTAAAVSGTDYSPPLFTGPYSANLAGTRLAGTSYTNNTGKPLLVSASVKGSVANSTVDVYWQVGNVSYIGRTNLITGSTPSYTELTTSAIVPAGSTYQLNVVQATVDTWFELS